MLLRTSPPYPGLKARVLAALLHVGGSAIVAGLTALLVFKVWYPWPFDLLAGGVGLFKLIVGVDVALGPLLTFAVFDVRKPRRVLARDLAVLVCCQLVAVAYGVHTMFIARPVAMALEGPRLRVVSAADVAVDELPQALPAFRSLSVTGPVQVGTADPQGDDKLDAISKALAGQDVGARPKFWRPWDDAARRQARQAAQAVPAFIGRKPTTAAALRRALAEQGLNEAAVGVLPIVSRFGQSVALINLSTGEIAGYAPIDGF